MSESADRARPEIEEETQLTSARFLPMRAVTRGDARPLSVPRDLFDDLQKAYEVLDAYFPVYVGLYERKSRCTALVDQVSDMRSDPNDEIAWRRLQTDVRSVGRLRDAIRARSARQAFDSLITRHDKALEEVSKRLKSVWDPTQAPLRKAVLGDIYDALNDLGEIVADVVAQSSDALDEAVRTAGDLLGRIVTASGIYDNLDQQETNPSPRGLQAAPHASTNRRVESVGFGPTAVPGEQRRQDEGSYLPSAGDQDVLDQAASNDACREERRQRGLA